jgi:hypothetical protein
VAWADALDRSSATTEEFFSVRLGNPRNRLAELAAEDFAEQREHFARRRITFANLMCYDPVSSRERESRDGDLV